jgi:hypothetical protein
MAEFSKQYCEIWDHDFPYDFDVYKIAKDLDTGNYYPIICEGFGFVAIAKDKNDQILVAFQDDEEDQVIWQEFDSFMSSQYTLLEEHLKIDDNNKIF